MDGENRKAVNGGASADGDASGVFIPVEQPRQSQYYDVEEDVYEEVASPKEADGSEDKIKALEEEIQVLRHRMKEMERSEVGTRSLAAHVTELEGELARSEKDKADLEARVRDLEARAGALELENSKAVEDALRKEEVIKSLYMEFDVEKEKISAAKKKKDEEVLNMEELEKWKKELGMEREKYYDLAREKEEEIANLNEELVFAREKANMEGNEKEKAKIMTLQEEYEISSLKDELKTTREKAIDDLNLMEKTRVTMAQLEEVNVSLKEELKLARENEKERLEMEKKAAIRLAEKEREVLSLKQEILLAREKVMNDLDAENMKLISNKEAEILLVNEHLNQAMVDARMKEENLEKEIKQLKDMNAVLEKKVEGLQFKDNDDVLVREMHLRDRESPKISWVSAAAVAASSGAVAAGITAFCLHHNKRS